MSGVARHSRADSAIADAPVDGHADGEREQHAAMLLAFAC